MAVRVRKQRWLAVLVALVSGVIVVGGGIFIYFALVREFINAESGRYLLSAIVQALAALLAIIFAGVIILWTLEGNALKDINELKFRIEKFVFAPSEHAPSRLWRAFEELKSKLSTKEELGKYKLGLLSMAKLILLHKVYEPDLFLEHSERIDADKVIEETLKEFLPGTSFEEFKENAEGLLKPSNLESFFKEVCEVTNTIPIFKKPSTEKATIKRSTHLNLLNPLELNTEEANRLWNLVHRARRARGWRFVLLASVYTFTIALGASSLALLNNNICPTQVATIPCITLAFMFVSVAATLVYLYDIVSRGKDA